MRTSRWLFPLATITLVGATGIAPATPANAVAVDLLTHLRGSSAYPIATGSSEYERDSYGREVDVTVRHVPDLVGTSLVVIVNRHRVGKLTVRKGGYAHREWDTERGQAVPSASAGDPVRVRTPDGALVVRGTYQVDPD